MKESYDEALSYQEKKAFYSRVLTIYGRKPVLEALQDSSLTIHRLHLSDSNKPSREIQRMMELAKKRGVEIRHHEKKALSRISKNARQDQGVALDIVLENLLSVERFLEGRQGYRVIALDGVSNPQNVGMIVRSCAAGKVDALLLPAKGAAPLVSPLTIKASAGTLFRLPLLRSDSLQADLARFKADGAVLFTLDSHAKKSYKEVELPSKALFLLGNETEGVSPELAALCDEKIAIPMNRGVESLNVAVTASLLVFMD